MADHNKAVEFNNQGIALREAGDLDGALRCYNTAIESDPNYKNPRLNRLTVLLMQEKFQEVLDESAVIIGIDPTNINAYNKRAGALIGLGRLHDALACWGEGLERAVDSPHTTDPRFQIEVETVREAYRNLQAQLR